MLNEDFKATMTIERFKLSGIIGIFKALVKFDISAMKPKVETSMKWGTIFLLPAKVDPCAQCPYTCSSYNHESESCWFHDIRLVLEHK